MWAEERDTRFSACKESSILLSHKYMTGALTAELMETAEVWANLREAALITYSERNNSRLCGVFISLSVRAGNTVTEPRSRRMCDLQPDRLFSEPCAYSWKKWWKQSTVQKQTLHQILRKVMQILQYYFLMTKPVKTSESCGQTHVPPSTCCDWLIILPIWLIKTKKPRLFCSRTNKTKCQTGKEKSNKKVIVASFFVSQFWLFFSQFIRSQNYSKVRISR